MPDLMISEGPAAGQPPERHSGMARHVPQEMRVAFGRIPVPAGEWQTCQVPAEE